MLQRKCSVFNTAPEYFSLYFLSFLRAIGLNLNLAFLLTDTILIENIPSYQITITSSDDKYYCFLARVNTALILTKEFIYLGLANLSAVFTRARNQ
jgi:hypothetical protein